jgi:hypothetical protein
MPHQAERREIMMHPHLPSPRQLAVPGIGFPQNFSIGPNVPDLAAFRDWSDDQFGAPPQPIDRFALLPSPGPWFAARWVASGQSVTSLMCYR